MAQCKYRASWVLWHMISRIPHKIGYTVYEWEMHDNPCERKTVSILMCERSIISQPTTMNPSLDHWWPLMIINLSWSLMTNNDRCWSLPPTMGILSSCAFGGYCAFPQTSLVCPSMSPPCGLRGSLMTSGMCLWDEMLSSFLHRHLSFHHLWCTYALGWCMP